MADTTTSATRIVAGGELHLRRASEADRWEISMYHRDLNVRTALSDGVLQSEQMVEHPILRQTFATPDEAATEMARVLA